MDQYANAATDAGVIIVCTALFFLGIFLIVTGKLGWWDNFWGDRRNGRR